MPLYSQKVVKSKYKSFHTFLSKNISYASYKDKIIKDILYHTERVIKTECFVTPKYIDVMLNVEIYYICCIEENGGLFNYPCVLDEDILIRIHKSSFKPTPTEEDFRKSEFIANVRQLEGNFDIDIFGKTLKIDITGFLIINMMIERCIVLNENSNKNEIYFKQVAISSEDAPEDIKSYLNNLEGISKMVLKKIDDLEEENKYLKDEIKRLQIELDKRNMEYNEIKRKDEGVMGEYKRLIEKLKEMEDKYLKEQKRANLLEIENSRNIDELKKVKKENSELLSKLTKDNYTLKDKIKKFINNV